MKVSTIRRVSVAGVAALAVLGIAGCSAINPQATTYTYAASDGVRAELNDVELVNILIVTTDEDAPGRLIGSIANHGDENQQVELTVGDNTVSWDVEAGQTLRLEDSDNEEIVDPVGANPGALIESSVTVGNETQELGVTVLDGTLEEYRQFVPEDFDEEELLEHHYDYEGPYSPNYGAH